MARLSRQELEQDLATQREEASAWRIAAHDLLRGEGTWFGGRGKIRVGIFRETSASGGYVLIREDNNVSVHYLDHALRRYWELHTHVPSEEIARVCALLEECSRHRRQALDTLKGAA